ncbi:MAG: S-adenosylmethionine:tRNA ribosyltransferase-isomerase [Candidatus Krumholzibacteriia bacterium]
MNCSDPAGAFDFILPEDLIAQEPALRRDEARLLVVRPAGASQPPQVDGIVQVRDLPRFLARGDLLVVNDSRVLPARLRTRRQSGGDVELLLLAPEGAAGDVAAGDVAAGESAADEGLAGDETDVPWQALARPARRLRAGERLLLVGSGAELEIMSSPRDGRVLVRLPGGSLRDAAHRWGETPLPPYIRRPAADPVAERRRRLDAERYQTVYAAREGSVAAPTAGLHFTPELLRALTAAGVAVAGVTLHVGPGTFQPPTREQVERRRLHAESFHLPAATDAAVRRTRAQGGRVVAVGTTSLRVLETVHRLGLPPAAAEGDERKLAGGEREPVCTGRARRAGGGWEVRGTTRLFLQPGDRIGGADALLTNFHLPGSSLIMLVAALLGGTDRGDDGWRAVYEHAVRERLRFYSYGDAMLVLPASHRTGAAPGPEEDDA